MNKNTKKKLEKYVGEVLVDMYSDKAELEEMIFGGGGIPDVEKLSDDELLDYFGLFCGGSAEEIKEMGGLAAEVYKEMLEDPDTSVMLKNHVQ